MEIVCAIEEALRLIDAYEPPDRPFADAAPRAGTGHGVSEAPRGVLYHRYDLDDARLTRECEQAIRNYDPCISCAAHFLSLRVDRA